MKKYASLIIDIKKSRDYEAKDRNQLQNFLIEAIDQLNIIFKETIVFPVTFSKSFRDSQPFVWSIISYLFRNCSKER